MAAAVRCQAVQRLAYTVGVLQPPFEQALCPGHGVAQKTRFTVLQGHLHAARGAPGGDVAAHDPAADHVHMAWAKGLSVTHALEPVLEEEHPDQLLCVVRCQQACDLARLAVVQAAGAASMTQPVPEQRIRRRIVLRPHLFAQFMLCM